MKRFCEGGIDLRLQDCLEGLKELPDESIDCVVTDPPYGILENANLGKGGGIAKSIDYPKIDWDSTSINREQVSELLRVSKNQVIFGANHFSDLLPKSRGWKIWDKRKQGTPCDYADCELIWTSFDCVPRVFYHKWRGFIKDGRHYEPRKHPTQKPLVLMEWLLKEHTSTGDLICDSFFGSGTTAVACARLNRRFVGFEINEQYFDVAVERVRNELNQTKLTSEGGLK